MTAPPVMIGIEAAETVVAPLPSQNRVNGRSRRTDQQRADAIVHRHKRGLEARRQRDLLSEKYLLHIDGSGDNQWADIWEGQRVEIPRLVSEFRKTENILRLVVDNAVAHHTTMPLRYFADSQPDRRARNQAIIDTLWANYVAHQQDLSGLFGDAMYLAIPAGFCPVHRYWREDPWDQYEPVKLANAPEAELQHLLDPQPGLIDCWVGNPFDTVFDRSSKRHSIYRCSYGRLLPASMVRRAFAHVPGAETLEGSRTMPSAALFQRVARDWRLGRLAGLGTHGTAVLEHRRGAKEDEDEPLLIICEEIGPNVEPDWPEGRLTICAVPGNADLRRGQQPKPGILLHDAPLPGSDYSWTNFYSHHRGEDILGKPWVEDLDQLQIDLNIALSKRWEHVNRMMEAPIVGPGGAMSEDMLDLGGYNYLELEPSVAAWRPTVMQWPAQILEALKGEIEDKRRAIYTGGGYQAASRGEAPGSRIAYRALVALQQADSSIHGPVNQRFRRAACDFMRGCWKQMKTYGDVPWLIDIVGDEYAHLAEPYIDNSKLSDRPPAYKLVNAFGPSPELRAQEVLELMGTRGADGQPFLRTDEARRQYPNAMIFDDEGNPTAVQRRRAKTVAEQFHLLADQIRAEMQIEERDPQHPMVQQAAMQVFMTMEARYPRLRDDLLSAHLATLSEITQDETADPIARLAAARRQDLYFAWQEMMSRTPGLPGSSGEHPGAPSAGRSPVVDRRAVAREMQGADGGGGTTLDNVNDGRSPIIASTAR